MEIQPQNQQNQQNQLKPKPKKNNLLIKIRSILDNLPYTMFHFKCLYSLGISWIIDGYEVSLLSILTGLLKNHFHLDDMHIAYAGSYYLLGSVLGAIFFGYIATVIGRKKIFLVTLGLYIISIFFTAVSPTITMFFVCRFLTGVAIGGEYTAIFAAIDEMIPMRYRGVTNILIDATWHLGSIFSCLLCYFCLSLNKHDKETGANKGNTPDEGGRNTSMWTDSETMWRILFAIGALIAIPVMIVRRHIPESPRWLYMVGDKKEAAKELRFIRKEVGKDKVDVEANEHEHETTNGTIGNSKNDSIFSDESGEKQDEKQVLRDEIEAVEEADRGNSSNNLNNLNNGRNSKSSNINVKNYDPRFAKELIDHDNIIPNTESDENNSNDGMADEIENAEKYQSDNTFIRIFNILFIKYPSRFVYALFLMISQSFFYNGIYYTYGLVLENYFSIDKENYGIYLLPLSIANLLGPLTLGILFDLWSRRKMIFISYFLSGFLLIGSGILFSYDLLNLFWQITSWCFIFMIASPGASSAHLTVSEIFPINIRSQALAIFYSIGLLVGGVISPIVFGYLINPHSRSQFAIAYYISGGLMMISAIVTIFWGVNAERKSLEHV